MKPIMRSILVATVMLPAAVRAQTLTAGPAVIDVQWRASAPLPEDVPFEVKPMGHEPGLEISYIAKGEGIAGVKESSLVLEEVRSADGAKLPLADSGRPVYEMGAFPRVSEDGRYAGFSVKLKSDVYGRAESVDVRGTVILLMASQRETVTAELATRGESSAKTGPFTVALDTGRVGSKLRQGGSVFGAGACGVQVSGPREAIIALTLTDGDQTLTSQGSMTFGDGPMVYQFPKPSSDRVTVRIQYWTDIREHSLAFGK